MMRLWCGLTAVLFLTACDGRLPSLADLVPGPDQSAATNEVGQSRITVTAREVELDAPRGFCVDPVSTRNEAAQAFVVFGNCASITGNPEQPQPFMQAVVTATVTSAGLAGDGAIAPQADGLVSFFQSPQGRAALSQTGNAETVAVQNGFSEEGAVFLNVNDSGPALVDGAQPSYWRGYFDAGTSVVALSVIALGNAPEASADGLNVLRSFVERNARPPSISVAAPATDTQPAPAATGSTPGLLDRLLR